MARRRTPAHPWPPVAQRAHPVERERDGHQQRIVNLGDDQAEDLEQRAFGGELARHDVEKRFALFRRGALVGLQLAHCPHAARRESRRSPRKPGRRRWISKCPLVIRMPTMPLQYPSVGSALKSHGQPNAQLQFLIHSPSRRQSDVAMAHLRVALSMSQRIKLLPFVRPGQGRGVRSARSGYLAAFADFSPADPVAPQYRPRYRRRHFDHAIIALFQPRPAAPARSLTIASVSSGLISSIAMRCTNETKSGMCRPTGVWRLNCPAKRRSGQRLPQDALGIGRISPQQPRQPAHGAALRRQRRPARARPAARAAVSPVRRRARRPWPGPCGLPRSPSPRRAACACPAWSAPSG